MVITGDVLVIFMMTKVVSQFVFANLVPRILQYLGLMIGGYIMIYL